jgi:hypothetical protein
LDEIDHKKVLEDMKLHNRAGMSCIVRPQKPKDEPAIEPQNEDDRTGQNEEVYEFGNRGDVYRYLHLNKGLRSFKDDYLSCSEEELGKKTDMRGFEAYRDVLTHKKKFDEYRFKWESQSPEVLAKISELIHGFNQIETPLFLQIVNPEIFQSMFPVQLISRYLQTPFKDKGPGDERRAMEVRKLQTDLARLFLLFHLKADTKNHIRTDSDQLSIIDPITRSYLRMKNRSDDALKMKYMSKDFDIKIFIKDCIKTFFHALGFLEIAGYDFYLQSTILEILRYTLELGLWNYDEMRELVSLLFEKIQSLISVDQKYLADIVQHQSSERISSSKKETEQERCSIGDLIKQTSVFTIMLNDCREQCAAICLQVIFLINDEEVKEAFESTTGRYNPKDSEYADKAWEFGYFKNIEFNYLINSIFTLFIIKFEPSDSTTDLANMANQILLIITDRSNDEYLNSMDMMDEATFEYIQELSHAVESTDPFSKPDLNSTPNRSQTERQA